MSKNSYRKPNQSHQSVVQTATLKENTAASFECVRVVKPEQMSLAAYQHIQRYLDGKEKLSKEDVTAVLRLSQHLRVFGLLSAVGYLNQAREGKVQERNTPVWHSLLGQLIDENNLIEKQKLMQKIEKMARHQPSVYMANWRKAIVMSNYWSFWAKAYQQEG